MSTSLGGPGIAANTEEAVLLPAVALASSAAPAGDPRDKAHAAGHGKFLYLSSYLIHQENTTDEKLWRASLATKQACKKNGICYYTWSSRDVTWTEASPPQPTTLMALHNIFRSASRLKKRGVTGLLLDAFGPTPGYEMGMVIGTLQQLCKAGMGIFSFDRDGNVMDIGSIGDIISGNDHFDDWIRSLYKEYVAGEHAGAHSAVSERQDLLDPLDPPDPLGGRNPLNPYSDALAYLHNLAA